MTDQIPAVSHPDDTPDARAGETLPPGSSTSLDDFEDHEPGEETLGGFGLRSGDEDFDDEDFDDGEEHRAERRHGVPRRPMMIVMTVLALVAGVLLFFFGPTALRVIQQRGTTLNSPDRVAGLTRNTDATAAQTTEYLRTALLAVAPVDSPVAAVYKDAAGSNVFFFGGTVATWWPDRELDALFGGVADDNGGVTGVKTYDPGRFGGVLRCGTTSTDGGQPLTVCGWADNGSAAVALFGDRSPDAAAALLRQMRQEMQHRG